jgi:integrase
VPRKRNPIPSYRFHKQSGQAVSDFYDPLTGRKRCVSLGKWDSPESRREHARIVAEVAIGRPTSTTGLTVNELMLAFLRFAATHYRKPDGTPTSEIHGYKMVIKSVRATHGHTPADQFGIIALKSVRQRMIEEGWCRRTVNQAVWRVKRMFKWAAGEEHLSPQVYQTLQVVGGLQLGRSEARETDPVGPVPVEVVAATLPHLGHPIAGMVRLQQATGMRPGELVQIRRCDIDTSAEVWRYTPRRNKTAHRGRTRAVFLGPIAQSVLLGLPTSSPNEYVFESPKKPGAHYTVSGYRQAIERACGVAGVAVWHPHQIRHTFATQVRKEFGLEHAQVVLDHARADVTQLYAEKNHALAAAVAAAIG